MKDITGRLVKLRRSSKRVLGRHHYREFKYQIGVAMPFYNNGSRWPEWEVLWDSGLRYLYNRELLDVLPEAL